jgi:hypothetical protein
MTINRAGQQVVRWSNTATIQPELPNEPRRMQIRRGRAKTLVHDTSEISHRSIFSQQHYRFGTSPRSAGSHNDSRQADLNVDRPRLSGGTASGNSRPIHNNRTPAMKALVYLAYERPKPEIIAPTGAIVGTAKTAKVTIEA